MTNIPEGMKPFDLEAAKRGEPICTRDGRDVLFFAYVDIDSFSQKVIAVVSGERIIQHFNDDGRYMPSGEIAHKTDLFMRKRKVRKEVYVLHFCGKTRIAETLGELEAMLPLYVKNYDVKKAILEIEE